MEDITKNIKLNSVNYIYELYSESYPRIISPNQISRIKYGILKDIHIKLYLNKFKYIKIII